MIEKTLIEQIETLTRECELGEAVVAIVSVSGGFMHRMYKVVTDRGIYAVKHLNSEIMKRPDAQANYARAEKIEESLEKSDIPIVPALVFHGKKMQNIDGQFFYVFRWQQGQITDWNHISMEQCYQAGNILGRMHAIEPRNVEPQTPQPSHIDWKGYIRKAREQDSEIASLLEENEEQLVSVERELNRARALLPGIECLSDGDMDPKNVMWDNGTPRVIDLECLDYGNPVSHTMELALQWAGIVTGELDMDRMVSFFDGYLEAYDNGFRRYADIVGVAYSFVEWLEYNIQRALGNCVDQAERELGISEVRNTVKRIQYLQEIEPRIKAALNTRLRKTGSQLVNLSQDLTH